MKKFALLLISALIAGIYSCKKDDASDTQSQYRKLIVGTWKSSQQNTKIYDINSSALLKDSTANFTGVNAGKATIEIYNANGSAYVTGLPTKKQGDLVATIDTTGYLNYTILASNLTLKQTIGGSTTKPILSLTSASMSLENTYTGTLPAGWGLDINATYKIVQTTNYTKQ